MKPRPLPHVLFNIIDILFEIMALEKRPEPYQDAVNVLSKLLDALLTLGEFQKATDLLSRIYIILKTYDLQDWQVKAIQQLAESAGDPQRIERIGKVLERREGVRLDEVSAYLKLLKPNSLQPLMKILGDLTNPKARRTVCDAICEIGKNSMDQIIPFLGRSTLVPGAERGLHFGPNWKGAGHFLGSKSPATQGNARSKGGGPGLGIIGGS